jgi:hypothetical protein
MTTTESAESSYCKYSAKWPRSYSVGVVSRVTSSLGNVFKTSRYQNSNIVTGNNYDRQRVITGRQGNIQNISMLSKSIATKRAHNPPWRQHWLRWYWCQLAVVRSFWRLWLEWYRVPWVYHTWGGWHACYHLSIKHQHCHFGQSQGVQGWRVCQSLSPFIRQRHRIPVHHS